MKKALEFLQDGESKGLWDEHRHEHEHPYYDPELGVYDGRDWVILKAIEIAFEEGMLEMLKQQDKNTK